MSKTMTIGSVGTSAIMKLMQQAIAATPGVTAQVVYSRDEERGSAFAREMGVPEHCADYGTMLERGDLAGRLRLGYRGFTCELSTAKDRDLDSGCLVEGERGRFRSGGALNEFPSAQVRLDGGLENIQLQEGVQNRLIFELARFRDAILERDRDFFRKMARQSTVTAAILEAAHAGRIRPEF